MGTMLSAYTSDLAIERSRPSDGRETLSGSVWNLRPNSRGVASCQWNDLRTAASRANSTHSLPFASTVSVSPTNVLEAADVTRNVLEAHDVTTAPPDDVIKSKATMTTKEKLKSSLSKLVSRISSLKLNRRILSDARNNNVAAFNDSVDNSSERSQSEENPSSFSSPVSLEAVVHSENANGGCLSNYTQNHRLQNGYGVNKNISQMLYNSAPFYQRYSQRQSNRNNSRRTVIQATTSDLLFCLGEFIRHRCGNLTDFETSDVTVWLRAVDQSLLAQGWQDAPFINPANVVFVFFIIRAELDALDQSATVPTANHLFSNRFSYRCPLAINCEGDLKALVMTCFYLGYAYMGSEISYPLRQFILVVGSDGGEDHERVRNAFWTRCIRIVSAQSRRMLMINRDPEYFANVLGDLIAYLPV